MKRLKLFFACLLMAVLSIGQVWAADPVASQAPANGKSYVVAAYVSSKYYALPNTTSNGSTLTGVEVTLDSDGKVSAEDAEGKTWTLTEGSTSGQFLFSYTSGTNTYYLYKNGTGKTNYNFKVSTGNQNYWTFTANGTGYTVAAYDRGTNNVNIQCNDGTFRCYSTASAIILLPIASDDPEPACTSEITITKADNPANGTFTIDNSGDVCIDEGNATVNVTANPNTGYHLATVTSTVGTVGDIDGNSCQITGINANTTISVTFDENPKYTVSFDTGEGNPAVGSKTETIGGGGITLPEGPEPTCSADGWVFAGWAEAAVASETTTAPTLLSGTYHPTANVTLYAVYKKTEGGDGAAVGTTMWSENFTGINADDKPESPTAGGSTVYGSPSITYAYTDGGTKTKGYTTGGPNGNENLLVSKSNGALTVSGIPTGKATTLSVAYATSGSGTIVVSTATEGVSVDGGTITIANPTETITFSLAFTNTNSGNNQRLDDIVVSVATTSAAGTTTYLSAPTCSCTTLDAPTVSVPDGDLTHNSAKLTWDADAHAEKYVVKFNGEDHETTNAYYEATGLTAETDYTYQVKAVVADGQSDWCSSDFSAEGNFTTESAPAATLTLSEIGETHNFAGDHTVGETVTLPLSATECSKTFVGWDPASNCTSAPAYAPGESYTLTATTQTLYAVYANPVGAVTYVKTAIASIPNGSEVVVTELYSETIYAAANDGGTSAGPAAVELAESATDVLNVGDNTNIFWVLTKDGANFSLTVKGGTDKLYCTNTNNGVRVGTNENNVFSISSDYIFNNATSRYVGYNHGDGGLFRCYTSINTNINGETLAFYKKNVNYEDYSTTCAAALAAPAFSVDPADGPFDTEISVELDAAEGTIYYTLNGTDPTNESTEYTDPIVLNTCGNKTIKAIAISSTNHSAVASATYEMNIPVPTNSQVAPYSPTEARDVIASDCYDGSTIMYVKGVVKSASAWNETYGNYDVVVRNIGNEDSETFTYYHMYAASGNTKFTADENIEAGDTILAAGVLTLYGSTYEFAQNTCYMVEHKKMVAPKTSIANEPPADPYTVAQAINFINNAVTYDLSEEVYVKGVVTNVNTSGTKYIDVKDAGQTNSFRFYNCNFGEFTISENDTIIGKGILYKHNTTYEFNGCTVTAVTPYVAPVVAVTGVELDQDAVELEVGEYVELEATVNPSGATNKNITWESDDETVATVVDGLVTAIAAGSTTITVTTEEGSFTATCTVTVTSSSIPENTDIITAAKIGVTGTSYAAWSDKTGFGTSSVYAGYSTNGTGTNANTVQLKSKDSNSGIILTSSNGLMLKGLSVTVTSGTNTLNVYARSTAYESVDNLYSADTDVQGTLIGTVSGTGNLQLEDGISYDDNYQYIGMRSANGALYLTDITITWGDAVTPPTPEEDWTEGVRTGLTAGWYYTMCLEQAVTNVRGASIWRVLSKAANGTDVILEEVLGTLDAGRPYIFYATAASLDVVYSGDAVDAPLTEGNNGLVGAFEQGDIAQSPNNYIIYNNALYYVNSDNVKVGAHRAYLNMGGVPDYGVTSQAPGRRRVTMAVHGKNAPTGIDAINAAEAPAKMIINGQLFILRGEKMYDATGRLVK